MLELVDLDVRYGSVAAVRGLSLHVDRGEIVGLIGPNGAGKSTTLHAIMGMVPTHSGRDPPRRRAPPRQGARDRRALRHRARARGPADLRGADGRGEPPARSVRAATSALERATTSSRCTRSSRSSRSTAAARRVRSRAASSSSSRSAARSSRDPRVILLDEPSLGLAPKIVDVVFEALAEIRSRGHHGAARRAARPAHGRVLRSHVPARERRDPAHADARRRVRHPGDGRRLPLVTPFLAPPLASLSTQVVVDAIGLGAIYALMAVGIGLVFGVLRLVNFAYGQLVMAGAYTLAYTSNWPVVWSIVACFVVVIALSLLMEVRDLPTAARPLADGHARDDVRDLVRAAGRRADRRSPRRADRRAGRLRRAAELRDHRRRRRSSAR